MIVPAGVARRYKDIESELRALSGFVKDVVSAYCEREEFAYVGRLKTLESLAEKIEGGRFRKWSDLDDMFGCTVIIPTLRQEEAVLGFLRSSFREKRTILRASTRKQPDVFRFEATRFVGRLKCDREAESLGVRYNTSFEVQIRSAFEHAWSVTTHEIYKSGKVDWKTHRIAAQLKAMVEQLDSLVLTFDTSSRPIVEHDWPDLTMKRELVEAFSGFAIPEELKPKDWSRFADNVFALLVSVVRERRTRENLGPLLKSVVDCVAGEIALDGNRVPLSLSLFQYSFGVLAKRKIIAAPIGEFCPLITEDLLSLYPETSEFRNAAFSLND